MEVSVKVNTIRYEYKCDSCNDGMMMSTGFSIGNETRPFYAHHCTHCNAEQNFTKQYPRVRYVTEDEEI